MITGLPAGAASLVACEDRSAPPATLAAPGSPSPGFSRRPPDRAPDVQGVQDRSHRYWLFLWPRGRLCGRAARGAEVQAATAEGVQTKCGGGDEPGVGEQRTGKRAVSLRRLGGSGSAPAGYRGRAGSTCLNVAHDVLFHDRMK